jgi:homogentisate 1,2-dioxygenase
MKPTIDYLKGFGNQLYSEAMPGALPVNQNSPQKVPYNLYAEQINGCAFTEPRSSNLHSWVYRAFPSVKQSKFTPLKYDNFSKENLNTNPDPNRYRWTEITSPIKKNTDLIMGMNMLLKNGGPKNKKGVAIYLYAANCSMKKKYFYNADGDLLFVPYLGEMQLHTEFGKLNIKPGEFVVIPRGIKFTCKILSKEIKGYICENFGQPFRLPELGTIGCNGLANARDFMHPTACFERDTGQVELVTKFGNSLWRSELDHSPLNVVAWHGNLLPYKYNLSQFNTLNTVSYDHPDPSIFTVLTSPSAIPGVANVDFVVFPERWMVAEHTFRPPFFHRNTMSEFMGLIYGKYDGKSQGFVPGGSSCHNCMTAHGPDVASYNKAIDESLLPKKQSDFLAFMFESSWAFEPTPFAMNCTMRDKDYDKCWEGFKMADI